MHLYLLVELAVLPIVRIPLAINGFCTQFSDVFKHPAQFKHFESLITGLCVSGNRTIAGIDQSVIYGTGYDGLHNFMLGSPWSVDDLRKQRFQYIKEQLEKKPDILRIAMKSDTTQGPSDISKFQRVVVIDATFGHHTSEDIYGSYWYWDHARRSYVLAQKLVLSTLVTPNKLIPLGHKLYHRGFLKEQKIYLEATKPAADADEVAWEEYKALVERYEQNESEHKKQQELATELVDECEESNLQADAYVFDAGLATKELTDKIDRLNKPWVSKLAKTRLVQTNKGGFETIESFAKSLPREVFKPVDVETRHGEKRKYWCFSKSVQVHEWEKLRIVISYDNEELEGEPIYLVTNKKQWVQPQKIVQLYMMRDPIEHLIRDGKQELGLEDCQQRKEDGVRKHWELSFTAHTFFELGFETIGQKSRVMEVAISYGFINHVKQLVLEGKDTKELLEKIATKRLNRLAT
jgi:hypothetical protein